MKVRSTIIIYIAWSTKRQKIYIFRCHEQNFRDISVYASFSLCDFVRPFLFGIVSSFSTASELFDLVMLIHERARDDFGLFALIRNLDRQVRDCGWAHNHWSLCSHCYFIWNSFYASLNITFVMFVFDTKILESVTKCISIDDFYKITIRGSYFIFRQRLSIKIRIRIVENEILALSKWLIQ